MAARCALPVAGNEAGICAGGDRRLEAGIDIRPGQVLGKIARDERVAGSNRVHDIHPDGLALVFAPRDARDRSGKAYRAVERTVAGNPLPVIGTAIAVGFLLGWLCRPQE